MAPGALQWWQRVLRAGCPYCCQRCVPMLHRVSQRLGCNKWAFPLCLWHFDCQHLIKLTLHHAAQQATIKAQLQDYQLLVLCC